MASAELESIVAMLRANQPDHEPTVDDMRAGIEMLASVFALAPDVRTEPADAGSVPAEWVVASGAVDDRVVLYLHGGGYVMGSINTHRELASRLSRAAGVDVTLEPWPDMIHVWHLFANMLPEGQQAIDRIAACVRQHLS